MAHWLSIIFFFGLLVALGAILELTLKAHWAEIGAALRGRYPAPARPAARAEARAAMTTARPRAMQRARL